jgi:hypothetical protein
MSHHQNSGQSNNENENAEKLKYLGMTVTNQNCIYEEIKGRLNLGNACYQ